MQIIYSTLGLLYILVSCSKSQSIKNDYINPMGTYKYQADIKKDTSSGDPGVIQVKSIQKHKIVLNLFVQKGAPSYNSGSAFDTLSYENNKAVYGPTEFDPSCKIMFEFHKKGVKVKEKAEDYNAGCGFGHAVVANGFFKKTSSKEPVFMNYGTGRKME